MSKKYYTRDELRNKGMLNTFPFSVLNEAYLAIHKGFVDRIDMFHSDVYYVRAALEKHTGYVFSLLSVEEAMKAEGWKEQRHLPRKKKK